MNTRREPKRRGLLSRRFLIFLAAGAVVAAGCAEIDTNLIIEDDQSGTRTMTAFISDSDMESNVKATPEELDQVVLANLPSVLEYTPFAHADSGYSAIFTLQFSDTDDYLEKVQTLLDLGGIDIEAQTSIETLDSPFSTGVLVEENFTSLDLLEWVKDPIVAAGFATESDRSQILTTGDTYVTFDGEQHESWSSQIYVDNTLRRGFMTVELSTEHDAESDTWERSFQLGMLNEDYEVLEGAVDEFFAEALPEGATLERLPDTQYHVMWTVTVGGLAIEEVAGVTDRILGTEGSEFALVSQEDFIPGTAILKGILIDSASCAEICAYADTPITDTLRLPDGWNGRSSGTFDWSEQAFTIYASDGEPVKIERSLTLESIATRLAFGMTGSSSLNVVYSLPADQAETNRELLAAVLSVSEDDPVEIREGTDVWQFEATIKSDSVEELASSIQKYLPGSHAQIYEYNGFFTRTVSGSLFLDYSAIFGDAVVNEGVDYGVTIPFVGKMSDYGWDGETISSPDLTWQQLDFSALIPTIWSYLFWSLLALLVIGTALVLFLFRGKIAAANARRRAVALAAGAAASPMSANIHGSANSTGTTRTADSESEPSPYVTSAADSHSVFEGKLF